MDKNKIEEIVRISYETKPKYYEIEVGVPEDYREIKSIGQLLDIAYKHASVDMQLKGNLIRMRRENKNPYEGIIGYDEDVIPATDRAIIASHDILFVGEIGQAKTKLAEIIAKNLLSRIPVIKGCLVNDIPTTLPQEHLISLLNGEDPIRTSPEFYICKDCEETIKNNGLDTRIEWRSGLERYRYILATPDISVKDLVGQIDAIKIAKRGVEIYDIESYSPGQLLQARHGIICIDELPVLDPRKQVTLLSVLQEGKFTTGSYPVIFKPDCKIIATANPIDYTHVGKIIEPLFDRLKSHIYTHYPHTLEDEMCIIVQEAKPPLDRLFLPIYILKIIAKIVRTLREHPEVNKEKGVSTRIGIHALEVVLSEAVRSRGIYYNVTPIPRPSDLHAITQVAKFELSEIEDNIQNRVNLLKKLMDEILIQIACQYIDTSNLSNVREEFLNNKFFHVNQRMLGVNNDGESYAQQLERFPSLRSMVIDVMKKVKNEQKEFINLLKRYKINDRIMIMDENEDGELLASVTELTLEGLRGVKPPVVDKRESGYATI